MTKRPQDTSAEEPDGGNPHIRFRGGPRLGDRPGLLNSKLSAAVWGLAAGACAASAPAWAENLLGFYVGGGLGESTVRSDNTYLPGGFGYGFDGFSHDSTPHFAWKAIAGIRPISIVGAELEYIDFGHTGSDGGSYSYNYGPDTHPRAIAAFGVGHLPLPIPFLDIYGKAGAAR